MIFEFSTFEKQGLIAWWIGHLSLTHEIQVQFPSIQSNSLTSDFIDFESLSIGGCRGHPMRPKLNLKNALC
jgi:hypothetical protein